MHLKKVACACDVAFKQYRSIEIFYIKNSLLKLSHPITFHAGFLMLCDSYVSISLIFVALTNLSSILNSQEYNQ